MPRMTVRQLDAGCRGGEPKFSERRERADPLREKKGPQAEREKKEQN